VTEASEVPNGFVGRNAIVWTGDGGVDEFVVQEVDGMFVTADRDVDIRGSCHFTLDKTNSEDVDIIKAAIAAARRWRDAKKARYEKKRSEKKRSEKKRSENEHQP
jgi:hypothetical protein